MLSVVSTLMVETFLRNMPRRVVQERRLVAASTTRRMKYFFLKVNCFEIGMPYIAASFS